MRMEISSLVCLLFGLSAGLAMASVTVRKTGKGPTGYEIDFVYTNKSATNVIIGGGLLPFTDQFHTSLDTLADYDPRDYHPGDFRTNGNTTDLFTMVNKGHGRFEYTTPWPSGTYTYAYLVDCGDLPLEDCSYSDSGHRIIDPDEPPFVNVPGDQNASPFQVPYDPDFQHYSDINLNNDFARPAPNNHRGEVFTVNYTSPGSIHPAPDVHDFTIYLPHEYGKVPEKQYPLLYLSHGGGGNGQDWQNIAQVSHILDNLIRQDLLEPTVVVMPSFYNLNASTPFYYGSSIDPPRPSLPSVRENYMKHLFPYVEANYNVTKDPDRRAFAGLSLGGFLTYEMWFNATDYFGYFGFFSGASKEGAYINAAQLEANPRLGQVGIFTGAGLYDSLFEDVRSFQVALADLDVGFINRIVPYGFHYWNTWQDLLWWFAQKGLWKDTPFTTRTGR